MSYGTMHLDIESLSCIVNKLHCVQGELAEQLETLNHIKCLLGGALSGSVATNFETGLCEWISTLTRIENETCSSHRHLYHLLCNLRTHASDLQGCYQ